MRRVDEKGERVTEGRKTRKDGNRGRKKKRTKERERERDRKITKGLMHTKACLSFLKRTHSRSNMPLGMPRSVFEQ